MNKKRTAFLPHHIKRLSIILVCCSFLLGFSNHAIAQKYNFIQYSVADGLAQSQAATMAQNKQGLLFIGTLGGLSTFDGISFTNYNRANGLPQNAIYQIVCDSNGRIWMGTANGICVYNGRKFQNIFPNGPESNNIISALAVDEQNTVWAIIKGQLFKYDEPLKQFKAIPHKDSILCMTIDASGNLWLAQYEKGIFVATKNGWHLALSTLKDEIIYKMTFGRFSGTLFCSTNKGIKIVENGRINTPNWRKCLPKKIFIYDILETQDGDKWVVANDGGVWTEHHQKWRHYDFRNGFTNETVNKIFQDKEGNIWLATNGSGIFRFAGRAFTYFDRSSGLMSPSIMSMTQMPNNSDIYFAGNNSGIDVLKKEEISPLPLPKAFSKATALYATANDNLWIGTANSGLWKYHNRQYLSIKPHDKILPLGISDIKGNQDSLWIAAINGLFLLHHNILQRVTVPYSIFSILPLNNDSVVLGTVNGAYIYNIKKGNVNPKPLLSNASVICMSSKKQMIIFGTDNLGLMIWHQDSHQWQTINQKDGLSCNYIYNLLVDENGQIWAGTGCGIDRISIAQNKQIHIKNFGAAYGLQGLENNSNASFIDNKGYLWFGTTKGVFRYNPYLDVPNSSIAQPLNIVLQSVKLFSKDLSAKKYADSCLPFSKIPYNPTFPPNQNNLSFTFKAISLANAAQIRYRYQLVGVDKTYIEALQNTVTYSSLPPGAYTFKVWASNADGNWQSKPLTWPFSINVPYYQTWYFRLGLALIFISLFLGLVYWRNQQKTKRLRWEQRLREEEQANVRQKTAEDFHDEIGNKLTRINLLVTVAESKFKEHPEEIPEILSQIKTNVGALYTGSRDIIWSLKPQSDFLSEVISRIHHNAEELFEHSGIKFNFNPDLAYLVDFRLPSDYSRNLLMIFKEATNNIVKHAEADVVTMTVLYQDSVLKFALEDNGKGIPNSEMQKTSGNGLANMRLRAERMNGKLIVKSFQKRAGSLILLSIPLMQSKNPS